MPNGFSEKHAAEIRREEVIAELEMGAILPDLDSNNRFFRSAVEMLAHARVWMRYNKPDGGNSRQSQRPKPHIPPLPNKRKLVDA